MRDNILRPAAAEPSRIQRLTTALAHSDEAAFTEFFELYCDRLFRYLLLLTRGQEDLARELLQTTLSKVVKKVPVCEEEIRLWNWLAAVARNVFLDHLRRARSRPALVPLLEEEAAELPAESEAGAEATLFRALDYSLGELPETERTLIEAIYFQKASQQSLAEEQQTTPKAIESKLARVRQKLRCAILKRLRYENS